MNGKAIFLDLACLTVGVVLLWLSVGVPACLGFALLAVFARGSHE